MTDALKFWVKEYDIDGYRCDVASFIPIDFWENARKELDAVKPVFMLAEAEDKELHRKAFDATYNWTLWNILHQIAINNKSAKTLGEVDLVAVARLDVVLDAHDGQAVGLGALGGVGHRHRDGEPLVARRARAALSELKEASA